MRAEILISELQQTVNAVCKEASCRDCFYCAIGIQSHVNDYLFQLNVI